jgi:metal-sulfur cluster biosynthetic enzyme
MNTDSAFEATLWESLRQVIDPELGINIVDLGLVYRVTSEAGVVTVVMTVTTPGCPMEHSLVFGVETTVLATPGVRGVQVEVVHDPRWEPSRMTPEARAQAGIR